jgi:hypothetical protein
MHVSRDRKSIALLWLLLPIGCAEILPRGEGIPQPDGAIGSEAFDAQLFVDEATRGDSSTSVDVSSSVKKDARTMDLPPDIYFPAVMCDDGVVFCEDFEAGGIDPAKWTPWAFAYYRKEPIRPLNVAFSTEALGDAPSGRSVLRIRQTDQSGSENGGQGRDGFLRTSTAFPLGRSSLHLRYFARFDNPVPNRNFTVLSVTDPGRARTSYETFYGVKLIAISEKVVAPARWQASTATAIALTNKYAPLDVWTCVEIEFRGAEQDVHLYVDGIEVAGSTVKVSYSPGTLKFAFGIATSHQDILMHPPDGFFDIRMDALVVSPKRIGCTR